MQLHISKDIAGAGAGAGAGRRFCSSYTIKRLVGNSASAKQNLLAVEQSQLQNCKAS